MTSTGDADARAAIAALAAPLRRIVAGRVGDPHLADDVVQETLLRVLQARDRLAEDALMPYAVITARNLVASRGRRDATAQRNAARLVEPNVQIDPEEALLRAEEATALRAALRALPDREREALVAHEVHGVSTDELARSSASTPAAVAARLARARARMRVEFVLAVRRIHLPTPSCRPVLLALSMGDRRRQQALDAGSHLLGCATCAALSEALIARKRVLTGVLPGGLVAWAAAAKPPWSTSGASWVGGAAATIVGAAVVSVLVLQPRDPAPDPAPAAAEPLVVGPGRTAVTSAALVDAARSGQPVRVVNAIVREVPVDEGFWLTNGDRRLWVQLDFAGESRLSARTGQRLDFEAEVVRHHQGFGRLVGLDDRRAAHRLDRQRVHLRVAAEDVGRP